MELRGEAVGRVRDCWRAWQAPADLEALVAALGDAVEHVIGEAGLSYADEGTLRLVATDDAIDVADHDARLVALEAASDSGEWSEGSADKPCVRRFGIAHHGALLAVATLNVWDDAIGHVGVFTAAHARGRGLAAKVSSAAVGHALTLGCIPQWRSRVGNETSARVGAKLGFVNVGRQMTVRVNAS